MYQAGTWTRCSIPQMSYTVYQSVWSLSKEIVFWLSIRLSEIQTFSKLKDSYILLEESNIEKIKKKNEGIILRKIIRNQEGSFEFQFQHLLKTSECDSLHFVPSANPGCLPPRGQALLCAWDGAGNRHRPLPA